MRIFAEKLLTPGGWRENMCVTVGNGIIQSAEPGTDGDLRCTCLTAGLFDTHQHGGEGYSAKYADMDRLRDYLVRQAGCGVTDVLMCLYSHTENEGDDYRTLMDFTRSAMELQQRGGRLVHGHAHPPGRLVQRRISRQRDGGIRGRVPERHDLRLLLYGTAVRDRADGRK